jgi:beta-fructofuranosidase
VQELKKAIMIKFNLRMLLMVIIIGGCSEDSVDTEVPPTTTEDETNLYPKPPSGWMGESNPYNTTGWVGDIMPYYDNGVFHIFFLHDAQIKPGGEGFHPIHKFESQNLVDFTYQGEMIPYGSTNEPDFAIGTGSPVKVGDTYYFYYTGHNGNSGFVQNNPRESVLLATSTDLENWTKQKDFKITAPTGYYDFDFRDPHVFYNSEESEYWMIISTQTSARKAVALLYTTQDPTTHQWELQEPIYTTTEEENYLMLECVDMFRMGDYWYMLFSENWNEKATHYRISTSSKGPWITPEIDVMDGEFLYAAKTAADGDNRYLFGWTARRSPENNRGNKEWAGNMVIHQLTQESDGTLGVKIPDQVVNVFTDAIPLEIQNSQGSVTGNEHNFILNGNSDTALQTFKILNGTRMINTNLSIDNLTGSAGFVLNAASASEQSYQILIEPSQERVAAYRISGGTAELVNQRTIVVEDDFHIELVIEGSIVVLYINGKAAFSNRVYDAIEKEWGIIAKGTTATFEKLNVVKP